MMQEELDEYKKAVAAGDLVGVADFLSDLLYVLLGTYITHGLHPLAEALAHRVVKPGGERSGPDTGGIGLGDAEDVVDGARPLTRAHRRLAGHDVG